jgi:hypothetical protein
MAAERELSPGLQDEGDDERGVQPRPRRRFRGLHWRHASQSHTPPPSNQTQQQPTTSPTRPFSLSLSQPTPDGRSPARPTTIDLGSPMGGLFTYSVFWASIDGTGNCPRILQMN